MIQPAVVKWMAMHRCGVAPSCSSTVSRAAAFAGRQQEHLALLSAWYGSNFLRAASYNVVALPLLYRFCRMLCWLDVTG